MAVLLQAPYNQFLDDDGNPLTGGFVYSYEAGTDTPKATYTDYTGSTPASNPVELDAAGRADIWIEGDYKFTVKDADGVTIRTVDHIEAVDAGGDMTKAIYDPANIQQQLLGTTAVQTFTNKTGSFSAGTASVAPITLTAGTNKTSATAGIVEYDGTNAFFTPIADQRGLIESPQTYILGGTTVAGANTTSAQSVFGVGVGLDAAKTYEFEAQYILSKTAGATSHTVGVGFAASGSLTFSTFVHVVDVRASTTSLLTGFGTPATVVLQSASNGTITGAIASANSFLVIKLRGTLVTQANAGDLTPQYTLSAAPGGAYSTLAGSYFKIWPAGGVGTTISIGDWA